MYPTRQISTALTQLTCLLVAALIALIAIPMAADAQANDYSCLLRANDNNTTTILFSGARADSEHLRVDGQWAANVTGRAEVTVNYRSTKAFFVRLRGNGYTGPDGFHAARCSTEPPAATSSISVRARGVAGSEDVKLELNGDVVATFNDVGRTYRTFTHDVTEATTIDRLRVVFDNDGRGRDVSIDNITVDGRTFETEAASVLSKGVWTSANGCAQGYKQRELIACHGWVEYQAARGMALGAPGGPACSAQGRSGAGWHTEEICVDGERRWEIIDNNGNARQWEAVNVRAYDYPNNQDLFPGSAADFDYDMDKLAERFSEVRLSLSWTLMQPNRGALNNAQAERVRRFLRAAHARDIGVILDVAHLGGGGSFKVPSWAWPAGVTRDARHSYLAWAGADNSATNLKVYLRELRAAGILDHDAVIAVEVVNEPHPNPWVAGFATAADQQRNLMIAYRNAIQEIRSVDRNKLVVLGAYHGGTRFGGSLTSDSADAANGYYDSQSGHAGYFDFNHARTELTERGVKNVVWTAHSYFTGVARGVGGYVLSDGQKSNGGRPTTSGRSPDPQVWAEGANSAGCYTKSEVADTERSFDWTGQCDASFAKRSVAQEGIRLNAEGSWRYAQAASMPFFMGEWGAGRQRYLNGLYQGWLGGSKALCDKLAAFDDVLGTGGANPAKVSWAVWSFNADSDGFGLYLPRAAVRINEQGINVGPAGQYLDQGVFGTGRDNSPNWNGRSWSYASPLRPAGQAGSCRA